MGKKQNKTKKPPFMFYKAQQHLGKLFILGKLFNLPEPQICCT